MQRTQKQLGGERYEEETVYDISGNGSDCCKWNDPDSTGRNSNRTVKEFR